MVGGVVDWGQMLCRTCNSSQVIAAKHLSAMSCNEMYIHRVQGFRPNLDKSSNMIILGLLLSAVEVSSVFGVILKMNSGLKSNSQIS